MALILCLYFRFFLLPRNSLAVNMLYFSYQNIRWYTMEFLSKRLNIFQGVDRDIVHALTDKMTKVTTEANSLLFREGDTLKSIYLVQSGQYGLFKLFLRRSEGDLYIGPGRNIKLPRATAPTDFHRMPRYQRRCYL